MVSPDNYHATPGKGFDTRYVLVADVGWPLEAGTAEYEYFTQGGSAFPIGSVAPHVQLPLATNDDWRTTRWEWIPPGEKDYVRVNHKKIPTPSTPPAEADEGLREYTRQVRYL